MDPAAWLARVGGDRVVVIGGRPAENLPVGESTGHLHLVTHRPSVAARLAGDRRRLRPEDRSTRSILVCSTHRVALAGASVDAVVVRDPIDRLESAEQVLSEAQRLVTTAGRVLVWCHLPEGPAAVESILTAVGLEVCQATSDQRELRLELRRAETPDASPLTTVEPVEDMVAVLSARLAEAEASRKRMLEGSRKASAETRRLAAELERSEARARAAVRDREAEVLAERRRRLLVSLELIGLRSRLGSRRWVRPAVPTGGVLADASREELERELAEVEDRIHRLEDRARSTDRAATGSQLSDSSASSETS